MLLKWTRRLLVTSSDRFKSIPFGLLVCRTCLLRLPVLEFDFGRLASHSVVLAMAPVVFSIRKPSLDEVRSNRELVVRPLFSVGVHLVLLGLLSPLS